MVGRKITVIGASGGIGQPLSLLLKKNPAVSELALYDVVGSPGVAADLSHIDSKAVVKGYLPADGGLEKAVTGAEVIVIPAGIPRKPGMSRDDLFDKNASIVRDLAKTIGRAAPKALVAIISNPVNSTVPIFAETLKNVGAYDPSRIFGVTTLDVVRANRFISELKGTDPADESVTVIGGHSGVTIIPLISQSNHPDISGETYDKLVHRIQFGGDEVVKAKDGAGSATLSMALAGERFVSSLIKGLEGESPVVPAFVDSPLFKSEGIDFFSSKVTLGPNGVAKVHELGALSDKEQELLAACKTELAKNIKKGVDFVAQRP